jgi:hypothetical protein
MSSVDRRFGYLEMVLNRGGGGRGRGHTVIGGGVSEAADREIEGLWIVCFCLPSDLQLKNLFFSCFLLSFTLYFLCSRCPSSVQQFAIAIAIVVAKASIA